MRTLRFPLDELLKGKGEFRWTAECQRSFDRFKEILGSDLLLTHYDAEGGSARDTSAYEGGDGLQPAGSRRTANGVRCNEIPQNDFRRWALTLLLYDFTIEYVQTEKFGNADILLRLINNHAKPDEDYVIASVILEEDLRFVADEAVSCLPLSFKSVKQETQSDEQLCKVYRYFREGWPEEAKIVDPEIRRLHGNRDSLCTVRRTLRDSREASAAVSAAAAPGTPRNPTNEGVGKELSRSPPKEAPVPWPRPTGPWKRVHVDYAGPIDRVHYLLVVDAHSKRPEVVPTQRITSTATISILRSIFALLGLPETLVSDNGTQFTSSEFQQFCSDSGIYHVTTAPFHPQ
ncbi:uncharacterized protein K02A2.6-like [Aedes albopictus]|uniref:Integrase catalytic domain-containing protein n=1 Tax=Aedes albopictus TaxID=7160 RepID=A0ABM1ZQT7_AEDAL